MLRLASAIAAISVASGSAVALFLWLLDEATSLRFDHPWLLYLLPLGGLAVAMLYLRGGESQRGNNVILAAIHEPGTNVPARMAPLVLAGTVVTHLFGGSAGREGTAVQIGGAIAGGLGGVLQLPHEDVRLLLMAGVAAGFGAVFGTPIAGAIFAVEVATIGRLDLPAILPALVAAFIADGVTTAWGAHHTHYAIASSVFDGGLPDTAVLLAKVALAGVAFGAASVLFAESVHVCGRAAKRLVRHELLRPVAGGAIVILLVALLETRDYLGLGVTNPDPGAISIISSFATGGASPIDWLGKIVFTAVTLGSGFKGGEVTPLFFVGATLGNNLAELLHAPADLLAGCGFVATFGAAANTPIAATVMGMELFGGGQALPLAIACLVASKVSGRGGIYLAQRAHQRTKPGAK